MSHLSLAQLVRHTFPPMLDGLDHVLGKAETWATDAGLAQGDVLGLRLAPDMLPLAKQVGIATDHAKGAPYRLADREVPVIADDDRTIADLRARIARAKALIDDVPDAAMEGCAERMIHLKLPSREIALAGLPYLTQFAIPNFYFHVTTAYDILRHAGVPLGKADFFGQR